MSSDEIQARIIADPAVLAGKPVVRGTRLSVEFLLNLLAHGSTFREVLEEYEGLTEADLQACLHFAANSLSHTSYMPLSTESV